MKRRHLILSLLTALSTQFLPSCAPNSANENALTVSNTTNGIPDFPREFRGAWSACIYNIDWPSVKGLSAAAQKSQLLTILNKMESLNMNALIFQVRSHADATYRSNREPWSPWLTGQMGRSPGYDPLQFCVEQAHARGIQVHAWFNPFRALPNASMPTTSQHIARSKPHLIKRYGNYKWMDISKYESRQIAENVILDVVNRYDIDGVHLDDYFYPYPKAQYGEFPDGKTPSQRREYVDSFVKNLYSSVKERKPWVRVGISPFGIWRPRVPSGIEANVDSYEHLAADSRKWLKNGWVDYLMPQLYWRDYPTKQSFSHLLQWWRNQGSRPVWPGIATARINSKDDPGRPASEIVKQVSYSRSIGKNWSGHAHWSVSALMQNKGGISTAMKSGLYGQPALVPPMRWLEKKAPETPKLSISSNQATWSVGNNAHTVAIQVKQDGQWIPYKVLPAYKKSTTLPEGIQNVAVRAVNRFGNTSAPVSAN